MTVQHVAHSTMSGAEYQPLDIEGEGQMTADSLRSLAAGEYQTQ